MTNHRRFNSRELLQIGALASRRAVGNGEARGLPWLELSRTALEAYLRWRSLTPRERRRLRSGPLTPHFAEVSDAWTEVLNTLRQGDGDLGAAVRRLIAALRTLIDALAVRASAASEAWGAPA